MHILMIDDEVKLREKVGKFLALKGHELMEAGGGEEGLALLRQHEVELVLLDLRMPRMDGLTCLRQIKASGWRGEVIMISAHGEIHDAVEAMKMGAYDYLTKPFYLDELMVKVEQVAEKLRLQQANCYLDNLTRRPLVYASPAMAQLMATIERVAPSDLPVLLTGETGVGKEVIARQVHDLSGRQGNFIAINCGAIPEALMESELFGYEKGAFSGAQQRKVGKIELAQGGTLFLDEIGELPKAMQVKLLRVLQEKEMERVGGTRSIQLDIRVVAATNRDLPQEIAVGRFREDLYYRLNVITLVIRPLRERKEDIVPLAEYFVAEMNDKLGKRVQRFGANARAELLRYDFPGNVRELKNLIERSMILSRGDELELFFEPGTGSGNGAGWRTDSGNDSLNQKSWDSDSDDGVREMNSGFIRGLAKTGAEVCSDQSAKELTLGEMEAARIREALQKHNGNRTRAAEELGISRRTIINKIKQHGLE